MVGDLGHFHSRIERQFALTRADLGQLGETVNVDDGRPERPASAPDASER
jgi:hypothetical protein